MLSTKPAGTTRPRPIAAVLGVTVVSLLMAGCTYSGGIEDAPTRKATWFSYLNGDDVRARCQSTPGQSTTERFEARLIYNGNFKEQVRSYEINWDGSGDARFVARAKPEDAGNLLNFRLSDPLATGRWEKTTSWLEPEELTLLTEQLADSGVFQRAPSGIDLKSWGSYWVSIACRDGEVFFNAWTKGGDRWNRQDLRQIVEPLDTTGVPFYEPHPARFEDSPTITRSRGDRRRPDTHFLMTTGDNGLIGLP